MDKTSELDDDFEQLVDQLNGLLTQMTTLKRHIELHEKTSCKKSIRMLPEMFAGLNFEMLHETMKPMEEEDNLSEISEEQGVPAPMPAPKVKTEPMSIMQPINFPSNISSATSVIVPNNSASMASFASALQQQQHIQLQPSTSSSFGMEPSINNNNGLNSMMPSLKRKRPNTLPVSNAYKPATMSSEFMYSMAPNNNGNSSALQTPSNGMLFGEFENGTGLTPLVPTLTPSELTPSTMAAFVKVL